MFIRHSGLKMFLDISTFLGIFKPHLCWSSLSKLVFPFLNLSWSEPKKTKKMKWFEWMEVFCFAVHWNNVILKIRLIFFCIHDKFRRFLKCFKNNRCSDLWVVRNGSILRCLRDSCWSLIERGENILMESSNNLFKTYATFFIRDKCSHLILLELERASIFRARAGLGLWAYVVNAQYWARAHRLGVSPFQLYISRWVFIWWSLIEARK